MENKCKTIRTFSIDTDLYLKFRNLCIQKEIPQSKVISKFIAIYVNQEQKGDE